MDTTDPAIVFDDAGICNHCRDYFSYAEEVVLTGAQAESKLAQVVDEIRDAGKGKEYDCVIGVSGGVDSTYVAYRIKELGLRPLAVHFDNGWDSEIAVKNIENLVKKLNIDLYTWVVDWEEFRALQLAYLRAGVPNLEAPSDHGIWAAVYAMAARHNVGYIISGHNAATEGILPWSWGYTPKDLRQMRAIYRRFGNGMRLRTFPQASFLKFLYYIYAKRIKRVAILNYLNYVKEDALRIIQEQLGWRDYGGKHYESVYTRFFQGYILPRRFEYDKRKAHLSTLICSGQLTRTQALELLDRNEYLKGPAQEDRDYVIKKLGLSEAEFERLMALPKKTHRDYPSMRWFYENLSAITGIFRVLGIRYK